MPLTLTLDQIQGSRAATGDVPGGKRETRTLAEGSLTIGRAPDNGWVLADPRRHLSRTHCVIAWVDGGYVLTDLSVNGVFLNGAAEPLTADRRPVLADGDEIRLGDYLITVSETATPPAAARPADTLGFPLDTASGPAFAYPVAAMPAGRADDPFESVAPRGQAYEQPRERTTSLDDLFKGFEPLEVWQGPSQPDNADAPVHAFAAPKFVAGPQFDDFDIDALLGDSPPGQPASGQGALAQGALAQKALGLGAPGHWVSRQEVAGQMVSGQGAPGLGMPGLETPGPGMPGCEVPGQQMPGHGGPGQGMAGQMVSSQGALGQMVPAPASAAPSVPGPRASAAPPTDAGMLLAAFLEGAGVSGLRLDPGTDPQAALRSAGAVFRTMVEGLREVLMSRAAVKHEFRAEQTMLGPCDNNPLKFSISAEDAVAALLRPRRPGYQQPLDAAHEAFADLKSHELAVMAGVQTALVGLLRRINPSVLEEQQRAGPGCGLLPAARKARCWELFRTTYKDIAREAEDNFQSAFGRDFARAYDAQVRQL